MTDAADPFHLERFVEAQADGIYEQALAELRAGQKRSHWMWFIFPQHRDLGRSATAKYYGLSGVEEARIYAARCPSQETIERANGLHPPRGRRGWP